MHLTEDWEAINLLCHQIPKGVIKSDTHASKFRFLIPCSWNTSSTRFELALTYFVKSINQVCSLLSVSTTAVCSCCRCQILTIFVEYKIAPVPSLLNRSTEDLSYRNRFRSGQKDDGGKPVNVNDVMAKSVTFSPVVLNFVWEEPKITLKCVSLATLPTWCWSVLCDSLRNERRTSLGTEIDLAASSL